MIKLYGSVRSRTVRPLWVLEELEIPYELIKIGFNDQLHSSEFLKINPNAHVPAIQDGDVTLFESMAINLYLARKYDKGLWPKTIDDEGRTFQWSLWAITELEEPVFTTLYNRLVFSEEKRDYKKADQAAERFKKPLGVLEIALTNRSYLAGSDFTIADLNVASIMSYTKLINLDISSAPNVSAWLKRCTERPAFKRVLALK